jgi:K+-sensing histidine kinase KdpD
MIGRSRFGSTTTYVLSVVFIGVCGAILVEVPAISAGAAAPVLLLAVVLVARAWGTGRGLVASGCASFAFIYFFLPPKGGMIVRDPNDWLAFITFTVSALVVGELAARAERRQLEAEEGRREIEQLYQQLTGAFERASESEAARRNEQLKASLLEALTHNLRTPLTAIKASVTALIGSPLPDSSLGLSREGRRELLQVINEESDRLNRFIEGLSAVDRPEQTESPLARSASVDGIVQEALQRAKSVLRHHRTSVEVAPDLAPVSVDPAAVAEVVYMLLDNASKYSPEGTIIRIAADDAGLHHVRLSVTDSGPGIPADLRERVFEKFFRIPGRDVRDVRRSGIGLGLPIARRIVESQAGRIWIDAGPGGGTAVLLELPAAAARTGRPEMARGAAALRA